MAASKRTGGPGKVLGDEDFWTVELPAPVEGPSYTVLAKVVLAVFLLTLTGLALLGQGLSSLSESPAEVRWIFGLATLAVLLQCVAIFRGRTRLDGQGIEQTGLWRKHMRWDEVKSARFLGLPLVSALWPPRLVLRSVSGRYLMFQGGTPALHEAFARVVVHVQSRPYRTTAAT